MPEEHQAEMGGGEAGSFDFDSPLVADSFLGKLQAYCPALFFKLSLWERDFLVNFFLASFFPSEKGVCISTGDPVCKGRLEGSVTLPNPLSPVVSLVPPPVETTLPSSLVSTVSYPLTSTLPMSDPILDQVSTSLTLSLRETINTAPLLSYWGLEAQKGTFKGDREKNQSFVNGGPGKSLAWSRGLGQEISSIKIRSARKKQ